MIYLDNASTTQIDPLVLEAMLPYLKEEYGNAGTLYALGRRANEAIEKARTQVAEFIGAKPEQIVFTSGGTESNNTVFLSLLDFLKASEKTHVITASNEHDSVLKSARNLCIKHGFDVTYLPVNKAGCVEPGNLRAALRDDTGLVSIMYMNNETGSENPIEELGSMCSEHGILFHTDCVQAAGCSKLNVDKFHCDFLSLSSHKIHGPKGVGALFVRHRGMCNPLIHGGSSQEFGLRGGTENVAGIVGFGAACALMNKQLHEVDIHNSSLKQIFYNVLKDALEQYGIPNVLHVNGDLVIKHGKTINLRFDGVDAETLLLVLDARGVCVSAGSACRSHESEPSHVLLAMGIDAEDARNSVRFSFSKMNSEDEVREAARVVAGSVSTLHAQSHTYLA